MGGGDSLPRRTGVRSGAADRVWSRRGTCLSGEPDHFVSDGWAGYNPGGTGDGREHGEEREAGRCESAGSGQKPGSPNDAGGGTDPAWGGAASSDGVDRRVGRPANQRRACGGDCAERCAVRGRACGDDTSADCASAGAGFVEDKSGS